ncbi:unnamed protein product [Anisakis simplex]|uniref:Uncharacterized protein n=1 Tax=Anisakis simplex TaxID=6269 RepID=A0A0M3K5K7_ANISI|nr:unnamed protein product [Anisakis simplex]
MVDGNQINTDFTSTYSKLFLEKMALLNRTFLEVLEDHVREIPDADLVIFCFGALGGTQKIKQHRDD